MGLYDTDPLLPEIVTVILILIGMIAFIYLSPYITLKATDYGDLSQEQEEGISFESFKQNKVVYYVSGGAVIVALGLIINGIYTLVSKKESLRYRNQGMHWIIWGSAVILIVIIIQAVFFATPRIS